ncbi:MAG TPA: response regulator, partial [Feifaniaceae bacterium]|nr:response regulator [Feifaniaceae bacterium]
MHSVVIIEDSFPLRQGMILTFDWRALNCFVAGEADNGEDGLRLICEINPEIVITDIRMPGMDGLDMIEEMRKSGGDAVCIVISAYGEFDYAQRAIRFGVSEFLVKPFEMSELNNALKNAVRRAEQIRHMRQIEEKKVMLYGDFLAEDGDIKGKYAEQAVNYIKAHFAESIGIGDIALALSMSESHLSRVFKESMGYTLGEYLVNYRISVACELLRDGNLRVSEVASKVGYGDQRYFSVVFRRIVGMTPNDYRAHAMNSRSGTA